MKPPTEQALTILLIDDDPAYASRLRALLADELAEAGRVDVAATLSEGCAALARSTPSCVLLSLHPPDSDGLEALQKVIAVARGSAIVVLVAVPDEALGRKAVAHGAQDYLVKGKTDASFGVYSIRYAVDGRRGASTRVARRGAAGRRSRNRSLIPIILTIVFALVAVGAGSWYWAFRNNTDVRVKIEDQTTRATAQVTNLLIRDGRLVSGGAELFKQGITRAEYSSYVRSDGFGSDQFPGLSGVGIIQRLSPDQVPGFLSTLRADGIAATSVTPRGQRSVYCVGSYADWRNLKLTIPIFGYDLCTVPAVAADLASSTKSGQQEVVLGSSLGQAFAGDFLLLRAIYAGTPTTVAHRQQQVIGWSMAIVSAVPLLESIDSFLGANTDLEVGLFDGTTARAPLVGGSLGFVPSGDASLARYSISAYGSWSVRVQTGPGAEASASLVGPLVFLGLGLFSVALLGALLGSISRSRARARVAVDVAVRSLRSSEERFQSLADAAPIGILEASPVASINFANPRLAEIAGRDIDEMIGRNWIDVIHPDDLPALLALVNDVRKNRATTATMFRIVRPDGELRSVRMLVASLGEASDSGYVVTVEDITEEVRAHEALEYQAFHDVLTGLPNRALFVERLNQDLARCRRSGAQIAVLFLDLDQFKIVNDNLGHPAGDAVLKSVADRFMQTVRAGETVCRLGGDEFTFIIQDVTSMEDATAAAERVMGVLNRPIRCAGQDLMVTASIGIVIAGVDAEGEAVLRDADTAMYRAKEAGRNRYALFEKGFHSRSVRRLSMEAELRKALEQNQFEVYYQPVIDPRNDRPVGAEALVRWRHPTRGLISPLEFIPVAEESSLILPIGQWVFDTSLTQLAAWDAEEGGPNLEVLAVNLSAKQLDNQATVDDLVRVLDRHGIESGRVSVEVTESTVMSNSGVTRRSLERLRACGLLVAIDDFGTGYSSLAYLHTLPVTTVKVDRSFVERLGGAEDSTPVVQAIVDMSHALGLGVVAEGVSSEALRGQIAALGCDSAQGFYWAMPMPAQEFAIWWKMAELQAVAHVRELARAGSR